jgi:hypothetical protein
MPCFAIRAVGQPGCRFGLFGTACIVLLLPKKWIDAMRSGERVTQKARRGFPPGLAAQLCQIARSHTKHVTKSTRFSDVCASSSDLGRQPKTTTN